MSELYGVNDELPADLRDLVIHDDIPVGPADDPGTATLDLEEDD